MSKKIKYLGIIPARAGSKGIPQKNIKLLNGKPLVSYTLEAAKNARKLDGVAVSSNFPEVLKLARDLGINTDYQRPESLSLDETPMIDTLLDVIEFYEGNSIKIENILLLQPTSPLRTAQDIDEAITLFEEKGSSSLIGVTPATEHPCEIIEEDGENPWTFVKNAGEAKRRQDYKSEYWFLSGAMYICNTQLLKSSGKIFHSAESVLFKMRPETGIDVDGPLDLIKAEVLLKYRDTQGQ